MAHEITAGGAVTRRKKGDKRGRSTTRQSFARPWPADSDDERLRDALARELIGVCWGALRTYGLTTERFLTLASEAIGRTPLPTSRSADVLTDADRLADAMNQWGEDSAYQDATGRPAVLSIRDAPSGSFASLARQYFPKRDVTEVIALGCKSHVLERVGQDKVARLAECVLFTGNSALMLAYSIRTVRRVLHAANFNRRIQTAVLDGWPDRAVWVEVSEEDFREFLRFIRPQIGDLMEMSHRWLTQRSAASKNRLKKKRPAGIQAFVFRE